MVFLRKHATIGLSKEEKGKIFGITEVHTDILNQTQKNILPALAKALSGSNLYMAGGTALALQVGHRPSVDFDFFRETIGSPEALLQKFKEQHIHCNVISISNETLYIDVNTVQVSFIGYDYPLLQAPILWKEYDLNLAGIDDIACMKLSAITNRGSRKDFIDLHYIAQNYRSIDDCLKLFIQKYDQRDIGHVIRSLIFFEDADAEPAVKANLQVNWDTIKKDFEVWVKRL